MKIKIRPDDTSMVQDDDWLQMDGWLAGLRPPPPPPPPSTFPPPPPPSPSPSSSCPPPPRDPGRAVGGYLPVGLPGPGWHR